MAQIALMGLRLCCDNNLQSSGTFVRTILKEGSNMAQGRLGIVTHIRAGDKHRMYRLCRQTGHSTLDGITLRFKIND
ncbi:hypothetical protein BCCGELA001_28735 [Bradyrhizobium sp. CCGE-LA001]|nr:hypothetical protein BCCGELA001_28735 [Bradyrhizobium sp. CCGE-LA001]